MLYDTLEAGPNAMEIIRTRRNCGSRGSFLRLVIPGVKNKKRKERGIASLFISFSFIPLLYLYLCNYKGTVF